MCSSTWLKCAPEARARNSEGEAMSTYFLMTNSLKSVLPPPAPVEAVPMLALCSLPNVTERMADQPALALRVLSWDSPSTLFDELAAVNLINMSTAILGCSF